MIHHNPILSACKNFAIVNIFNLFNMLLNDNSRLKRQTNNKPIFPHAYRVKKMGKAATCSVCLRSLSINATGLLRTHGPLNARCFGSGKPPRPLGASSSAPSSAPFTVKKLKYKSPYTYLIPGLF